MASNTRSTSETRPIDTICADLTRLRNEMRAVLARLDPRDLPPAQASTVWRIASEIRRAAAAAETLLAKRAEEAEEWRRAGWPSAAEWFAAQSGTSIGQARSTLETSENLAKCPDT